LFISSFIIIFTPSPDFQPSSHPTTYTDNYYSFSITLPPSWQVTNLNRPKTPTNDQLETEYLIAPTSASLKNLSSFSNNFVGESDYVLPGMYLGLLTDEIDLDHYLSITGRDCTECAFAYIHESSQIDSLPAAKITSDFPPANTLPNEKHRPYTYYLFNAFGHGWIVAHPIESTEFPSANIYPQILSSFRFLDHIGYNHTWISQSQDNLSFSYPSTLLNLNSTSTTTSLTHSLPYSHPNPCNFSGNLPQNLESLTDFSMHIQYLNQNLKTTLTKDQGSQFIKDNMSQENKLKISKGFIDSSAIGNFSGYRLTQGVEGCGNYTYYYPIKDQGTLKITRDMITEFNTIVADYSKYLSLPGIVPPYAESKIFTRIVDSIQVPQP
jgi:hypothetical protein